MRDDHAAFVGSIPEYYDRILVPLIFEEYAKDIASRLRRPQSAVLELACGTGAVTKQLLGVLAPAGRITATDLNHAMLDLAGGKVGDTRIDWRPANATNLPFDDGVFDAVVCQFGWMFFPDKAAAMREARRVLKSGGRLLYNVWDRISNCPVYFEVNAAVHDYFPKDAPAFYEVPFSMPDIGEHRRLMDEAGFRNASIEVVGYDGARMPASEMADGIVRGSPTVAEIEQRGGDVAEVVDYIARRLEKHFGGAPFSSPMRAIVCSADAP
ncbi:MAG: class I SAM-dependent methyltransferase [Candidatus Eremiobacteraeota bacterium]|nr:class I SAM-dependent methyltransferase [Candidatus Eremiobacteraeota bacterium]